MEDQTRGFRVRPAKEPSVATPGSLILLVLSIRDFGRCRRSCSACASRRLADVASCAGENRAIVRLGLYDHALARTHERARGTPGICDAGWPPLASALNWSGHVSTSTRSERDIDCPS